MENSPMKNKPLKLATLLKEKRIEAGLTQKDIADKLQYTSSQFVSNWERGTCRPPLETLGVLVDLLGISKQDLIQIYMNTMEAEIRSALSKKSK